MGVKANLDGPTLDVDDIAAEVLAATLRDERHESMAVLKCPHGDYVVMPTKLWYEIEKTPGAAGSRLVSIMHSSPPVSAALREREDKQS